MNRRTLLLSVGAVCAGAAGCTELEEAGERISAATGPDRPWANLPVTVTLDDQTEDGREGFEELLRQGMAYWEDHSEEYAGYEIKYTFDPDLDDHEDADIVVELVEDVQTCSVEGHDQEAVGCAPVITDSAPDTATVEIKDGFSDDLTLVTIKHEFGHTLGLGHDDEPQEIMSSDPADRIPDYETRVNIHERYRETVGRINEGTSRFNEGIEYGTDREWEAAQEQFEKATEHYDWAHTELSEMRDDAEAIEADGAVELLTEAENFTRYYGEAGKLFAQEARARADGDHIEAEQYQNEAREAVEAAREYDVEVGYTLAEALGLQ
ncbi:hypothetical protein [Natranaeroarchaeum sulfidigenes]|uniref:Zn-dependent protease n=1 Tax=Natranaeroarchaeum sulfidigenes TaxID=2784880 RepID=A0A897MPQ0_9EURY|nr:hypothetical protein [Natranaeroarchaeum sulfidigenes]QSG02564.1 Zn-dependent protease [Natranaeroarchaeum sulfidigenes]